MSEPLPDDRLVSGAIISAEIWFAVDSISSVMTLGRDGASEPGCVSFQFGLKPVRDLMLEGPVKALSELSGVLCVTSQRERTERLGRLSREANGYRIGIHLFETELDRFISLIASGLEPHTLKAEFDIEVAQWFEREDYWDDVRYPSVQLHEYRIDWSRPRLLDHGR